MPGWQVSIEVPQAAVDAVEAAFLESAPFDQPPALTSFECKGGDPWQVDAIFENAPDLDMLQTRLTGVLAHYGVSAERLTLREVPPVDWVEEALKHHQPVEAGRFYVHGSHHKAHPGNRHAILIDAGMAFGTGQHETTLGCLRALDALAKRWQFTNPLDLGCGSGLLAIAMAKVWPCTVIASDIDPEAVRVAAENARLNGVGPRIDTVVATGLSHPRLRARAPYDLVTANILARPLIALAGRLSNAIAPGGILVLSGLLQQQETAVAAAYRNRGMPLVARFPVGEWMTLVLEKP